MRRLMTLLIAALALPMAAPVQADDLRCRLKRACVMGGPCVRADVTVLIEGADSHRPTLVTDGVRHPADRVDNFFGTTFHGFNDAEIGVNHPGELFVRPSGRGVYIRRADVRGVTVRTDFRGRCRVIETPEGVPQAVVIK